MTDPLEFLVSHGRSAALSRCRDAVGVGPQRGDTVVIRGQRGLELGEVLCASTPEINAATGELIRRATPDDRRHADLLGVRGRLVLEDLQRLVESQQLPMQPLDIDLTLDGERADIEVLSWGPSPLTMLQEELRSRHRVAVYFLDRSRPPAKGCDSCGSGGCGSCGDGGCGDGGCSSGNCSRGATSAAELTQFFLRLREEMNLAQRVPLL